MKKIIVILSMMFLLLGVGYAGATTIGFEEFSKGAVISGPGVFNDVVFSQGGNILSVYPVVAGLGPEFSGVMAVGSNNFDTPYAFRADFLVSGVNYVSVVMGDANEDTDRLLLVAYDANNQILSVDRDVIASTVYGGPILEVTGANIAYVKFGSTGIMQKLVLIITILSFLTISLTQPFLNRLPYCF
jgi:hypothetical protein